MKLPESIVVAQFPHCHDGLKTLNPLQIGIISDSWSLLINIQLLGEIVINGEFDICALNDGKSLESYCSHCLKMDVKLKCSCKMTNYCSKTCQVILKKVSLN